MLANAISASHQVKSSHRKRAYSSHSASRFHKSPKLNSKLALNAKHGRIVGSDLMVSKNNLGAVEISKLKHLLSVVVALYWDDITS